MSKTIRVYQVDSFTKERFKGNPAGVVPEAEGLSDDQMMAISREFNNSETDFVFPPERNDYDVRVRFFTPTCEVPSCGHATIAAHYVRAVENKMPTSRVRQKIGIGILPVKIEKHDGDYRIFMTQKAPEFLGSVKGALKAELLDALGLGESDLDERCPLEHVSTGHSKLIIGLKTRGKLNSLKPDLNALNKINEKIGCSGYFLFTLDSDDAEILTHARMFAPQIGISEDPVTGNGNGPLGAYLVKNRLVKHDGKRFSFKGRQGEAIKRTGTAYVEVEIKNDLPVKINVGGNAVIAFQADLML